MRCFIPVIRTRGWIELTCVELGDWIWLDCGVRCEVSWLSDCWEMEIEGGTGMDTDIDVIQQGEI